jgi:hypothetical protein
MSRQARGYGLTFLAMSALLVAALEADRNGKRWLLAAFCAAGIVGSLTLPHFAVGFVATGAVPAMRREIRRACIAGMALSLAVIAAWYAPHLGDIRESVSQDYGVPIETWWLLTAPFDHILVPGLVFLDEAFVRPTPLSLVWAAALTALMASSPLLHVWRTALIVCSGTVATVLAFWLVGSGAVPRFFSFLLVPLFALMASGSAAVLARVASRPPAARTVIAVVALGVVAFSAAPLLVSVPTKPREAQAETAASSANGCRPRPCACTHAVFDRPRLPPGTARGGCRHSCADCERLRAARTNRLRRRAVAIASAGPAVPAAARRAARASRAVHTRWSDRRLVRPPAR